MILIVIILAMIIFLLVVLVKMLRKPKKAMKTLENAKNLKGQSYQQLCKMFGRPTSVSSNSDGAKEAYWRISNGFAEWNAYAKDTSIYAVFDENDICVDYAFEQNRSSAF